MYLESHFAPHFNRFEVLDIFGIEEHEPDCGSPLIDFEGVPSQDDPLQNNVQRVAHGQSSVHHWRHFPIQEVHLVHSVNLNGGWWEVVVVIEGAEEVALIILLDFLCELCFLGSWDHPRENGLHHNSTKSH